MSIYPTRTAAHVAIAGFGLLVVGLALREAAVVAWAGALLGGIALARAVTLVGVMRIRRAGFEMLWTKRSRTVRVGCGCSVCLEAEVRNRDTLSARYDKLRVIASPALEVEVWPPAGEVPATGSVKLRVQVRALRVGHHGIYGLALEVRGGPGLFEVPLTFANPFGVEVLPRALSVARSTPRGGRGRTASMVGAVGRRRGDGTDLRELREHQPGDPFRRIAWKASARRGLLVVKEFDREERDVVLLVLDASVELWAGTMGQAPLDESIDLTAALAASHLSAGDLVGLCVMGARELGRVAPDSGRRQAARIASLLVGCTAVMDWDRSGCDEADLAAQVGEHMRALDPRATVDLSRGRFDKLAERAERLRAQAPFELAPPRARGSSDAAFRHYAACFGMHLPRRLQPDAPRTSAAIIQLMTDVARARQQPRVSVLHMIGPAPEQASLPELEVAVRRLKARHVMVRWSSAAVTLPRMPEPPQRRPWARWAPAGRRAMEMQAAVGRAVVMRAVVAARRGERALSHAGVRVVRGRRLLRLGAPADARAERAGSEPLRQPQSRELPS